MLEKFADLIEIKKADIGHTKFSIAIPTFKRTETLVKTINIALSQTYDGEYKIVIVDNNPNRDDKTELFMHGVTDFRVSYYKNSENVGMVNNWNQCILASASEWVVLVHDDDLLTDNCLKSIDETISAQPYLDVVLPNFIQMHNPYVKESTSVSNTGENFIKSWIKRLLIKNYPISANLFCDNIYGPPTCGLALRRDAVIEFGGFPDRCIAADWDFMSKFSINHRIAKCKELTGYYIWAVNASMKESTMEQIRKDRIAIIKDIVDYSMLNKFYYKLLKNDFKKKFNSKTTDVVDYSFLYRMIRKYYSMRI